MANKSLKLIRSKPEENKRNLNTLEKAIAYIDENYDVRNNIVLNTIEWKPKNASEYVEFSEHDLFLELQLNNYKISKDTIKSIVLSNRTLKFNPLVEYLEKLPKWDGKIDYIALLSNYLKVTETDKFKFIYHIKKWFVRLIRCMLDENYFNKQMIVFVQEAQNTGKTTFCRWLCPPALSKYFSDTITSNDKDEQIQLSTCFLILYDELFRMYKDDINKIKSQMSKTSINIRLPYAPRQTEIPRRCSFIGNTNNAEFLTDPTGSIRFICFELKEQINFNYKKDLNIDDIYSQAYALYKSGSGVFEAELNAADTKSIQEYNRRFQVYTTEMHLIQKYFSVPDEDIPETYANLKFWTSTDVLKHLQGQNLDIRINANNIGKALIFYGYQRFAKKINGTPVYGYNILLNDEIVFE
jgi:predicted P-loop ATPase